MTPHEFLSKWQNVDLKERTASQSHFNDLCHLLGVADPIEADPRGEWFTFEKGAAKTGGGAGWADVWRKGCFAWEYKGRSSDLDRAFDQLLRYSVALESPPLLIVSDMERIRIHTNWTNTIQQVYEIALADLVDARKRDLLRACFEDPDRLRPAKTRQTLTEEAARQFAALAQRLRARGHDAHGVAHFVNRLVFCMFAEDVGLLANSMFTRMLEASRAQPAGFAEHARTLFQAMKSGGMVGFEKVEWFNGGLFDDDQTLPLENADIDNLLVAARLDWSEIDPSILGTLFERGLDPDKRSQLGAHYTAREKIMQIVRPVLIDPLEQEWDAVRSTLESLLSKALSASGRARTRLRSEAARVMGVWRERLVSFRILDPACGSGNFLYLSLLSLKDLEHRTNLEAEQLGLPREFPRVGPENVLGIELNPYAAELARVSVWIGEIQWMRRNGFDAARNPVLRNLENIENRDAVLNDDGRRAEWPKADVVVGNPPFLGNKKMISELGAEYTRALRKAWPEVPGGADLVCYWFAAASAEMYGGQLSRAGLVSTNSIRGGANRAVLQTIVENGRIFEAWADQDWAADGAAVRVSMICFDKEHGTQATLDGRSVSRILADLSAEQDGIDLTQAQRLKHNAQLSFMGVTKSGPFDLEGAVARRLLTAGGNPHGRPNSDVIKRSVNGMETIRRIGDRWILDFGPDSSVEDAALYEAPFRYAQEVIYPVRQESRTEKNRAFWWRYERPRPEMYRALHGLKRFIATAMVSKHRVFVWLDSGFLPENLVIVIARDDDTTFGILQSRFHQLWALRMGTFLGVGNDTRYTPSTTFETFPFPDGLTPDIPAKDFASNPMAQAVGAAAVRLNELRDNWLNPPELVRREPEVVPGFPDRLLPKDDAAEKELSKRTLTNLYNTRPTWLLHAHQSLDEAVADAYGWGDDLRTGALSDDAILARLFELNHLQAGEVDSPATRRATTEGAPTW